MVTSILALSLAATQVALPGCTDSSNQRELNQCASDEFVRADAELNREWREQARRARTADAQPGRPSLSQYDALLESQRDWLRFRDSECDRRALHYWGGSIVPLIRATCMTDLTRARVRQLRESGEQ